MSRLPSSEVIRGTNDGDLDESLPLNLSLNSAGNDVLGLDTVDLTYSLITSTATKQLKSSETWLETFAEFVGSAFSVFVTVTAIESLQLANWQDNMQATFTVAVASAFAIVSIASGLKPRSFAFLNPALTLAGWIVGLIDYIKLALFVVAQILGAMLGAYAAWGLAPVSTRDNIAVCTSVNENMSIGQAFLLEFLLSLFLVYTVTGTVLDKRNQWSRWANVYATATFVTVLIGGFATGGSTNPAKSLAVAIIQSSCFTGLHWIYWLAPMAGGTAGGLLHQGLTSYAAVDFYQSAGAGRSSLSRSSSFRLH